MVPDKLLAKDEEMKSLLKAVDTDKVISIDDTEKRQSTQTKLEKQTSCPPDKQMTLTEEMINNQISKLVEDALNISDDLSSLQDPENESKDECQDVPTTEIVIKVTSPQKKTLEDPSTPSRFEAIQKSSLQEESKTTAKFGSDGSSKDSDEISNKVNSEVDEGKTEDNSNQSNTQVTGSDHSSNIAKQEELEQLNKELEKLKIEQEQLKNELVETKDTLKQTTDSSTQEKQEHLLQIEDLKNQLKSMQKHSTELSESQNKANQSELEVGDLQDQLKEVTENCNLLENNLSKANQDLKVEKEIYEKALETNQQMKGEVESGQQLLLEAAKKLESAKEDTETLRINNANEVQELKSTINQLEQKLTSRQEELVRINKTHESKIAEANRKYERTKAEVSQVTSKADKAKETHRLEIEQLLKDNKGLKFNMNKYKLKTQELEKQVEGERMSSQSSRQLRDLVERTELKLHELLDQKAEYE